MKTDNNEVKLIQYFDEHWYRRVLDNGEVKFYPSVTTKLGIVAKYGLDRWRGDIGNREADIRVGEAQNRGSRIHRAWQVYQNEQSVGFWRWQVDEEKPKADFILQDQGEYLDFLKLHSFTEIVKPKFLASEFILYSDKFGEAGTCDNIFGINEGTYMINGSKPLHLEAGIYIGDLKSGKEVYDEAFMQVASYIAMYGEMGLDKIWGAIKGALILHTNAKTRAGIVGFGVDVRTIEELREDFQDFRAVSKVWERKNKNASPKDFMFPQVIRRTYVDNKI